MTKQNQLTNERRLSLTATLLQIWQITFSNQSSNVRLTNNCALDSNDLYCSESPSFDKRPIQDYPRLDDRASRLTNEWY